jgi:hypothetical protein
LIAFGRELAACVPRLIMLARTAKTARTLSELDPIGDDRGTCRAFRLFNKADRQ